MPNPPFVGREPELARLRGALDEAAAGDARVVLLAGEAGIGKTRLAEELARDAGERGALVLWGRSRESSGAPPYWPWIQAGRELVSALGLEVLPELVEPDAVELQRLFPELADLVPGLTPMPLAQESAQFRLFEAMTAVYRRLAERRPVLLILEDLHWADAATLLLLQHLAAGVSASRLLFLGTYRDREVDRAHPLAASVAELARLPGFERIALTGLSEDETATYVRAARGVAPSPAVRRRIFETTEGNPFFMREVVHLLTQSGQIGSVTAADIEVPEGVRAVLGRHLAELSEEATQLLRTAAIVGREFTHDTLALVAESAAEELISRLEESLRARVIEEDREPGRYRFVHALMHETVLTEVPGPRRALLHGEVGEALERRWGDRAERYASRLAPHFIASATLSHDYAEKALHYSRLAGQRAEAQYAWEQAAGHYEQCIEFLEDDGGLALAEMLHAHGRASLAHAAARPAWRSLMRAMDICRAAGEPVGFARAALDALKVLAPRDRLQSIREEALSLRDHLPPELVARLLVGLNPQQLVPEPLNTAMLDQAREVAATHELADVDARLLRWDSFVALDAGNPAEAERLATEEFGRWRRQGREVDAADALQRFCQLVIEQGQLNRAARLVPELIEHADRYRAREWMSTGRAMLASIHLVRRDVPEYQRLIASPEIDPFYRSLLEAMRHELEGRLDQAVAALPSPSAGGGSFLDTVIEGHRSRVLLAAGRVDEARVALDAWAEGVPSHLAYPWFIDGLAVGDALPALGSDELVRSVYARLVASSFIRYSWWALLSLDRLRGTLALRTGLIDEAEQHLRDGVEWCERERCLVELGRCLLDLAEVVMRRDAATEGLALLERAATLFDEHGARGYLRTAEAKLEALRATSRRASYPDGLSPREVEVLRLVAAGRTNTEIAERLVLSVRTVERHMANTYTKTGLTSRTQAAAYALRHGLLTVEETAGDSG